MLQTALRYLERGWSVIPLEVRGKKSLIKWGEFQQRRPTAEEVTAWWTRWPDANIGIVTGQISGLLVLDVDGEEGDESLQGKHVPVSLQAKTGKGQHHYFKHPGQEITGTIALYPGLDVRADGNYVVAPPSIHANGSRYEWVVQEELADAPKWLLDGLKTKSKENDERAFLDDINGEWYVKALKGVSEGERNTVAAKLCGRWLALGLSQEEVWEFLLSWNAKNTPPAPENELRATLESITKLEADKRVKELNGIPRISPSQSVPPATACEIISDTIRVSVTRITRFRGDPPQFSIHMSGSELSLSDISELIEQGKFRTFLARHTSVFLDYHTRQQWEAIARIMLLAIQDVDIGDDATPQGSLLGDLRSYLSQNKPIDDENFINGFSPFIWKGDLMIVPRHFRRFTNRAEGQHYSTKVLAKLLRQIGCEYIQLHCVINGRKANPRVWKLPKGLMEE